MIRIQKQPSPKILTDKSAEWTEELLGYLSAGQKPPESIATRYRHPEIKKSLIEETKTKCVYCESKFTHAYFGDVEHVVPKSIKPELTFVWGNLTFSCAICNNEKHDYHSESEPIVHPIENEPSEHVCFIGAILSGRNAKGVLTIAKLSLNRTELLERRSESLQMLLRFGEQILCLPEGELRTELQRQMLGMADSDQEFSFMKQSGLKALERV